MHRLNQIRNAVMHPAKQKRWTEQDFIFVHGIRRTLADKKSNDLVKQLIGRIYEEQRKTPE